MNSVVQHSLDSFEASLHTLIDSVSSYNPSSAAAVALIAADDEVTAALEQLDEHQNNHRRIQELRATSAALDEQLTDLLTTLSETHQALKLVPSTSFPAARDVPYDELLSYASKISRFTRPSNPVAFRKLMTQLVPQLEENPPVNAPALAPEGTAPVAKAENGTTEKKEVPMGMTEEELHDLDPSSHMPFTPWPSEEVMHQGQIFGVLPTRDVPPAVPGIEELKNDEPMTDGMPDTGAHAGTNGVAPEAPPKREEVRRPAQPQPKPLLGLELYDSDDDD